MGPRHKKSVSSYIGPTEIMIGPKLPPLGKKHFHPFLHLLEIHMKVFPFHPYSLLYFVTTAMMSPGNS